ncbi:MAG TPA: recombinase family protein [Fimbriiglobus sp.]|jgi:site-specific DNA recombinase
MTTPAITPTLRPALYARVSSQQQADANTIASQVEALRTRIREDDLRLDAEFCFQDEGHSGATLLRPALERLRDQAAAGVLDRLYVHSPDRLARSYAYQVLLLEEFRRGGVEVVFLNRPIGRSPEEDLLLQVQGMMAEYERAKISERSRRGKRHAARNGSVNVLSGAPYGYRYIGKFAGGGRARYELHAEHAAVVRTIFTGVGVDGHSIREVCRRLKTQQIPSPTGKSYWDPATVWGILRNPAYVGRAEFGKTREVAPRPRLRTQRGRPTHGRRTASTEETPADERLPIPVPAIIDDSVFAAVAEQLAANRKRRRESQRGARYLLQGLVACGECGYAYYGKPLSRSSRKGKSRQYAYYRCIGTDAYRFGGQRVCRNSQCRTDTLDKAVWDDTCGLLADPDRVRREYEERRNRKRSTGSRPSEQVDKLIAQVRRGIARLIDAYEEGLLEKDEFEPRVRESKTRLARLEKEAAAATKRETEDAELSAAIGQLEAFTEQIRTGLQDADWQTRREILRALIKRVEVGPESIKIVYKVGPRPFEPGPERGRSQHCGRRDHPTLRRAYFRGSEHLPRKHARPQPTFDHSAKDGCPRQDHGVVNFVEEALDVGVENPAAS